MNIALQDVAAALAVRIPTDARARVATGWSVDTRTMERGDLFFALRGPNHDGHNHVADAFEKGAAAAIVEHDVDAPGVQLIVGDSLASLQGLAAWARLRWGGEVVGITGSAGKTTTKDVVAHLLAVGMEVGKTTGNYNNHVGVPLSVLRLPDRARVGVLEIGMNHAGEIRELAQIARPNVGVVTNVGAAHIESFADGIDGVAAAKRELVESLPADGTAVLNADDPHVASMSGTFRGRVVTFGIDRPADVRAEGVELNSDGIRFQVDGVTFCSALIGRVLNLLCGITVAGLYGIRTERLVDAARSFSVSKMRGTKLVRDGMVIYDDCYNANPDAARAMIDVLRDTPARRRVAVLGEMLELGRWAEPLHREVGKYVADSGISVLIGIRGVAREMVDAAIQGGMKRDAAFFFQSPEEAGEFLKAYAREGDAILFKGSRGTQVERALHRFLPAEGRG